MGDYRIRMQFDIDADEAAIRDALTTRGGIASWWSDTVEGEPGEEGGDLYVSFPDLPQPFHFRVGLDGEISWETQEFPPWWEGTTIRWWTSDEPDVDGVRLHFVHGGFDPDADIIPIITPAWAQIIGRLTRHAETGDADPFARVPRTADH